MQGLSKQRALESLRARIARIENKPPLADAFRSAGEHDKARFDLPKGLLHELFADGHRDSGALLGFALAAGRGLLSVERPAILYLQRQVDSQEMGFPYGPGLAAFGFDPEALVLVRPFDIVELLWAAEEALTCGAVAAVIADIGDDPKALDFTASRRLGLRAMATGTTFLMLRYGIGRTASAARMRWHVEPAPSSSMLFDPRAPGDSRWRLTLEKGLWQGKPTGEWLLGWTKNGFDILYSPDADRVPAGTSLPRAFPAALGDRLPQTA